MSSLGHSDAKLLKCPNCGAPLASKPVETVVKCHYCGSLVTVRTPRPPAPPPTIIIETRHERIHGHRLRRLLEAAELTTRRVGNSPKGDDSDD